MIMSLSHKLDPRKPVFGDGAEELELREMKSQTRGDSCQAY